MVVVIPDPPGQANSRPTNVTSSLLWFPNTNPWLALVVTDKIPVTLLYAAVEMPKDAPVVATPTTSVITPPITTGRSFAPIKGAYPSPAVDPIDRGNPPLGIWFVFTSDSLIKSFSSSFTYIPVNLSVVTSLDTETLVGRTPVSTPFANSVLPTPTFKDPLCIWKVAIPETVPFITLATKFGLLNWDITSPTLNAWLDDNVTVAS